MARWHPEGSNDTSPDVPWFVPYHNTSTEIGTCRLSKFEKLYRMPHRSSSSMILMLRNHAPNAHTSWIHIQTSKQHRRMYF